MATLDRNGYGPVAITRDQRDALHYEIASFSFDVARLEDFANVFARGRVAEARDRWARLACAARILEQIGWDKDSDRDGYTLIVDGEIAAWAAACIREAEASLSEFSDALAAARAGEDVWVTDSLADPAYEAQAQANADQDLEIIGACRAILDQLEATR